MTLESLTERNQSRLKVIWEQFWYKLLCYELVNPRIKISSEFMFIFCAVLIPKERLFYVIPRKDFGRIFFPSLGTHVYFKSCPTVSAQHDTGSCFAESRFASFCGGLHTTCHGTCAPEHTLCQRWLVFPTLRFAATVTTGHDLIQKWNPKEFFLQKIIWPKSAIGSWGKASPLRFATRC